MINKGHQDFVRINLPRSTPSTITETIDELALALTENVKFILGPTTWAFWCPCCWKYNRRCVFVLVQNRFDQQIIKNNVSKAADPVGSWRRNCAIYGIGKSYAHCTHYTTYVDYDPKTLKLIAFANSDNLFTPTGEDLLSIERRQAQAPPRLIKSVSEPIQSFSEDANENEKAGGEEETSSGYSDKRLRLGDDSVTPSTAESIETHLNTLAGAYDLQRNFILSMKAEMDTLRLDVQNIMLVVSRVLQKANE